MDDFDRKVFCLAGLVFDAVDLQDAIDIVHESVATETPCFISTPNLNFLINADKNPLFRESVIQSDLVLADGMPLIWIARLLGIPLPGRVAGSDLFEQLGASGKALSVYFFGGMPGVAEEACNVLNFGNTGLRCAGFDSPGFGTVEEMSGADRIRKINESGADFLIVSLGAAKGQEWIMRNRNLLSVPLISHLGAVVNFVAETISRSPRWMQKAGLEWLWRIKEEPALVRRYWFDGLEFMKMLIMRILPYAVWIRFRKSGSEKTGSSVEVTRKEDLTCLSLTGMFERELGDVRTVFRNTASTAGAVEIDMSCISSFGSEFLGLVLILRKHIKHRRGKLTLVNIPQDLRKVFYWNCVEYLLEPST